MSTKDYISSLNHQLLLGNATEHTHRPALKIFIEFLQEGITATNEPKRRTDCGAPDFIITKGEVPLGYVEAKDVGVSLDKAEKSEQLKRYRDSLGNLVLTDYLEFRWYVRPRATKPDEYPTAEHRLTARLATVGKDGKLHVEKDGQQEVIELLNAFLAAKVPTVRSAKELAVRMAKLAQLIRDIIAKAISREEEKGTLHQQMEGFREVLIHDLTEDQFADMYAQTICYGLFTARVNKRGSDRFTRQHAWSDLPKTNPFLRKMFNHIAGPDLDDRIAWAVDDLAELLHVSNMSDILQDFGKSTRRQDPVVHFYETFLAAYDPQMREVRGVYYTPEPVVSYIVRSIDHILKTDFKLKDGLADSSKIKIKSPDGKGSTEVHKVLILDPATGTGTFLYEVINQIYASFRKNLGMWSGYVSEHLLPRLFGFELLMAPYAVAHMKLGLVLADSGYDFKADERLRVYLTNTLEEAHEVSKLPLFTQWLAEEANEASKVKQEAPVMVILGNPPYSGSSANVGKWIVGLLRGRDSLNKNTTANYFTVDGEPLGERNPKMLNDDYVKFIRFAQWRIEQTGYGVFSYISNHSYLDNPTFRGMRQSLMETFDEIYLVDIHGNSKKRERSPNGVKDENVFDIQQGVAIGIFVKRHGIKKKSASVRHAHLWGVREAYEQNAAEERVLVGGKYYWLWQNDVSTTSWEKLDPQSPYYLFIPYDMTLKVEYESWPKVTEFMTANSSCMNTARDALVTDIDRIDLERRIQRLADKTESLEGLANAFELRNTPWWNFEKAANQLRKTKDWRNLIIESLHRPFDARWLFNYEPFIDRPRKELNSQMLRENVSLVTTRQTKEPFAALVTDMICSQHKIAAVYDRSYFFPLYLYSNAEHSGLFGAQSEPSKRQANLEPQFIKDWFQRLGLGYLPDGKGDGDKTFGPEDVFDYIYAGFYSPTYRARYADFLKIDFPRLPLTSNVELFRELCALGSELVALHLMKKNAPPITTYPVAGENEVQKVRYTEPGEAGSDEGRVWINREQYFEGVPPEVWNFQVGGYQPCQKWLKDRKGRKLTFDDLTHYQHIVSALSETIRLMSEIDETIEAHGGWPIQ